jgi:hypothetical protein
MTGIVGSISLATRATSQRASEQVYVGHDCSILGFVAMEKRKCFLTGCCDGRFKSAVWMSLFDHSLN